MSPRIRIASRELISRAFKVQVTQAQFWFYDHQTIFQLNFGNRLNESSQMGQRQFRLRAQQCSPKSTQIIFVRFLFLSFY